MSVLKPGVGATLAGILTVSGTAYIGDTSNANVTLGLTINQGAADDNILALKSSDVAHGVTTVAETDTFAYFKKNSATDGGVTMAGLTEVTVAVQLDAVGTTETATRSTAAVAPIYLNGYTKSGTGVASMAADKNILAIGNNGTTRFIHDSDGDFHADSSSTTF